MARASFDPAWYEGQTGVPPVGGDTAVQPFERLGFRPTIEVNGIHGGYGGPGSKTIIPARAFAKLSARLAAGQDPARALAAIETHLRKQAPPGLRVSVTEASIGGPALRLDSESPLAGHAAAVLRDVCGCEPEFRWDGASIPVLSMLSRVAGGAQPLLVGFGREDDQVHAPNESFALDRFRLGYLFITSLLSGW